LDDEHSAHVAEMQQVGVRGNALSLGDRSKMHRAPTILVAVALVIGTGAGAAEAPPATPIIMQQLLDCRAKTDNGTRLACYDAQVGGLSAAIERKDVVVADRAQIKAAKRSLFGLALPDFNLFGSGDDKRDREEFAELQSTIVQARKRGDRNWVLVLEGDAKWVQTDSREFIRDPLPGMKIRIKRAAMGSYLANIEGQTAVRVHREN